MNIIPIWGSPGTVVSGLCLDKSFFKKVLTKNVPSSILNKHSASVFIW